MTTADGFAPIDADLIDDTCERHDVKLDDMGTCSGCTAEYNRPPVRFVSPEPAYSFDMPAAAHDALMAAIRARRSTR
jgi:hypothetical protein